MLYFLCVAFENLLEAFDDQTVVLFGFYISAEGIEQPKKQVCNTSTEIILVQHYAVYCPAPVTSSPLPSHQQGIFRNVCGCVSALAQLI